MEKDKIDELILKAAPAAMEPSENFESGFWKKVYAYEKEPRIEKIFEQIISWIPTPSFAQVTAILLIALVIGGGAGIVSALPSQPVSLSGFREIKGVPMPSISGTYLKLIQSEISK